MKRRILSLALTFVMVFTLFAGMAQKAEADDYEYAWFPAPQLLVTQLAYEAWTGNGENTGASHGSNNTIDINPGGRAFAPFTGKIVYRDPNWGYVLLQSTDASGNPKKVYYADGSLDYMTVAFMHDDNIDDLPVGKIITQGSPFYDMGTKGGGTGAHIDLSVYRGAVNKPTYSYGQGDMYAFNAFYINTEKTVKVRPGNMVPNNYITNGGPADWSNLWVDLDTANRVTVTFDPAVGSCPAKSISVTKGTRIGSLPVPTLEDYVFEGWYWDSYGISGRVTEDTIIYEDATVYANWVHDNSLKKIEFDVDGGDSFASLARSWITINNAPRKDYYVIMYTNGGRLYSRSKFGYEVALNDNGKVVAWREYGSENNLLIPSGTYSCILSWQVPEGSSVSGFLRTAIDLAKASEAFIGIDYETGELNLYNSYAAKLANEKYIRPEINSYVSYKELPVAKKTACVFKGWKSENGNLVGHNDVYQGYRLTAVWDSGPDKKLEWNGHTYYLFNASMSWKEARSCCEGFGGHLVTINSREEQEMLVSFMEGKSVYYIGATDANQEGRWEWVTGEPFEYTNWDQAAPEPNGGVGENYGYIAAVNIPPNKTVGEWLDTPNVVYGKDKGLYSYCNAGYICELDYIFDESSFEMSSGNLPMPSFPVFPVTQPPSDDFLVVDVLPWDLYFNTVLRGITYTICYDANGGSGTPEDQSKTSGETLQLSTDVPVRSGYTFLGWSEDPTAVTAQYLPGGDFTKDAEVILYAVWEKSVNPGDVDRNAQVNTTDVILMRRWIAGGYGVAIDQNAADVDGNGVINTTDVILMRRYIAGGYGIELKPGNIS